MKINEIKEYDIFITKDGRKGTIVLKYDNFDDAVEVIFDGNNASESLRIDEIKEIIKNQNE